MLISRFTDLSLRVLMYLTYTDRDTLVTVNELSERLHWSRNHMGRIVYFMSTKGWVETHRGRFGGITLKHKPSEYRIGDLVQILEEQGDLIDCLNPRSALLPATAAYAISCARPLATSTPGSTRPRSKR